MGSLFLFPLLICHNDTPARSCPRGRAEKGWGCRQRAGLRRGWSLDLSEMPGWSVTQAASRPPSGVVLLGLT